MTWTRLSDNYFDRPESLTLSRSAVLLDIEGMVWSNRLLTNGRVPKNALGRLTSSTDPAADVAELVDAGIWTETDDAYMIDWSDQEDAERVIERRSFNADRQRKYRERGEKHARGDHSDCTASCPSSPRNASRNGSRNGSDNATVTATRPDPTRPQGRGGQGHGADARSAGAPRAPRPKSETPRGFSFSVSEAPDGTA